MSEEVGHGHGHVPYAPEPMEVIPKPPVIESNGDPTLIKGTADKMDIRRDSLEFPFVPDTTAERVRLDDSTT